MQCLPALPNREHLIQRPATLNATVDSARRDTGLDRPRLQVLCTAEIRDEASRATIGALLCHRGPSAIARFIVSSVVDAFQCETGNVSRHISYEGVEGVPPALADLDAPAPVESPVSRLRVRAPSLHVRPNRAQWVTRRGPTRAAPSGIAEQSTVDALTRLPSSGDVLSVRFGDLPHCQAAGTSNIGHDRPLSTNRGYVSPAGCNRRGQFRGQQ